eukprot:GFYU01030351.1.p1 GENE.GFYU01030351.1~~GFYU01030351.1.p1  ORF type:complete len:116 (-),score=8.12 GFYU01030351.1:277-624(-)
MHSPMQRRSVELLLGVCFCPRVTTRDTDDTMVAAQMCVFVCKCVCATVANVCLCVSICVGADFAEGADFNHDVRDISPARTRTCSFGVGDRDTFKPRKYTTGGYASPEDRRGTMQ